MGVISSSRPVPPFSRMMTFIDGENLVFRYQEMLKIGYAPHSNVVHEENVFVWCPGAPMFAWQSIVLRATYYTYATGTDERVQSVKEQLKTLTFPKNDMSALPNKLYPQVFKKTNRQKKGKGVDIQMTVDILTHVYQNSLDIVCLLSGDGDNRPVIETVVRNGKQIYLAAFSSGLNPDLPHLVDDFICLDKFYFVKDSQGNPIQ